MHDLNLKLKQENTLLERKLQQAVTENKRLLSLLSANTANGLSNDDLHQFNNAAALLDANLELALDALLKLPHNENQFDQLKFTTLKNFITAAQSAKTELVGIVNA